MFMIDKERGGVKTVSVIFIFIAGDKVPLFKTIGDTAVILAGSFFILSTAFENLGGEGGVILIP